MLTPAFGQTSTQGPPTNQPTGLREAQHMVPALASLTHSLDSRNIHAGDQFRATLNDNVHLNNGVELRKGDALRGQVVTDDMNTPGQTRLAIRFTEADLKNGQTVPVKATIVSLYTPSDLINNNSDAEPDQIPNSWNDGTLRVDQVGVVSGVDLHSQIASRNSGVFVSTKKNVKIPAGSELALAIAAQPNAAAASSGL
jgi:hypothetical protein